MNIRFASVFLVCVACSGSAPSGNLTSVDSSVPVSQDAGDDVEVVESSSSVATSSASSTASSSAVITSVSTSSTSLTSSSTSSVASSSVTTSASSSASSSHTASDAGTVEKVPCVGPNGCYSYVYATAAGVTDTCGFLDGAGLNSQSPFTTVGNNLESVAPSFCATEGDMPMTTSTISTNFCNASATSTCSDPTTEMGATTYVAVSVLVSNTDGSVITGTLTLKESSEDGSGSCSENLTFTATRYADVPSSGVCPAVM